MARKLRIEYAGAIYHPPALGASVFAKASTDKTVDGPPDETAGNPRRESG